MNQWFRVTGFGLGCRNIKGGALIAALLLVAISGVMGATILFATSTDLQISGNYRRAIETFYAAEAGLAETQVRLVGSATSYPEYLGDPSSNPQPNWSAYLFANSGWTPTKDWTYTSALTNYVPVVGNLQNTSYLSNSIQTDLPYWTKVRHKTEYDAERAGHKIVTPHYQDLDGLTRRHSKNRRGNLVLYGFPSENSGQPTQFTAASPTHYSPVEIILSQGEVERAVSIIQSEVAYQPGPPLWAPVYAGTQAIFSGSTTLIQGLDACGLLAAGRPPLSLGPSAALVGTGTFTGNPSIPRVSPLALDLYQYIDELKVGAQIIGSDLVGVSLGTAAMPTLQYAEPASGLLTLTNITGYGILLVKGSLQVFPPFNWKGLIVVSGGAVIQPGLSPAVIRGAVYVDQLQVLSDDVTIILDTCSIAAALRNLPLQVLTWRQLL